MTSLSPPGQLAVILAGGSGERFWPLSRQETPKQLLALARPGRTLLDEAMVRARRLFAPHEILIATTTALRESVLARRLEIPPENVLAEPCRRNTAGALVHLAAVLRARFGPHADPVLAVLTADHAIGAPELFTATLRVCLAEAAASPALVVIGIPPDRPETGYGYLEISENAAPLGTREGQAVLPVERFCEKPDPTIANGYLEAGRFYWNSGMFFWRLSSFLAQLEAAHPALRAAVDEIAEALARGADAEAAARFARLPSLSIDHALMERAGEVRVVRGDFPWDDVGSWDALARHFPRDAAGNVAAGDPVLLSCRDSIVYNAAGNEVAVCAIGLEDLVVIVCPDAVLVAPKARVQEVREAVRELRRRGAPQV